MKNKASNKSVSPFDFEVFHDKIKWKMISSCGAVEAARNMSNHFRRVIAMCILTPHSIKCLYKIFASPSTKGGR